MIDTHKTRMIVVKNRDDKLSRFDTLPKRGGQTANRRTDGQTELLYHIARQCVDAR